MGYNIIETTAELLINHTEVRVNEFDVAESEGQSVATRNLDLAGRSVNADKGPIPPKVCQLQ